MNPSSKKNLTLALVAVLAVVVIGVIVWSSGKDASPVGNPTMPSSTIPAASSTLTSPQISSTISISTTSVTIKPMPTPATTSTAWQPYAPKTVQATFSIPPGWAIGPDAPVSIDNFNHAYQNDSVIPIGGAEIDMASIKYYGTIEDLIKTNTMSGTVHATSSVAVDNVLCIEVSYGSTYAPGYPSSNIATYCQDAGNGLLYEVYLSYRAGDPNGAQYVATFGQFLNRVQFGNGG